MINLLQGTHISFFLVKQNRLQRVKCDDLENAQRRSNDRIYGIPRNAENNKNVEMLVDHSHNPCFLILFYTDLIGQKHKQPRLQLRYVVFSFQNICVCVCVYILTGSQEEQ